jgi:hypothetical protein
MLGMGVFGGGRKGSCLVGGREPREGTAAAAAAATRTTSRGRPMSGSKDAGHTNTESEYWLEEEWFCSSGRDAAGSQPARVERRLFGRASWFGGYGSN